MVCGENGCGHCLCDSGSNHGVVGDRDMTKCYVHTTNVGQATKQDYNDKSAMIFVSPNVL